MDKLVIDHSYALGIAWDKTLYRNHGVLYQSPPGTGQFQGAMQFAPAKPAPGSMVVVPPSPSLAEIGALKTRCRIYTTPKGGGAQRQNIIEGHLSFAFFINPDLSLQATFLDSTSNWTGIRTPARAVVPNRWFELEYSYDGISAAEILVDGVRVASSYSPANLIGPPMLGPVRGIGPRGVAIGHWPEPDDRYTFNGYIRDVQVYKRDDVEDLLKLLDRCCLKDLTGIYDLTRKLRRKGYDLNYANRLRQQLVAEGSQLAASLRGTSEAASIELQGLLQQFLYAMSRRGSVPLGPSLRPLMNWMAARLDPQEFDDLLARMQGFVKELPVTEDELQELAKGLCFSKLKDALEEEAKRTEKDPDWKKLRERFKAKRPR
jgi:hypothetical protein